MSQIALRNCTFIVQDGTPTTPNQCIIHIGDGNVSYDEKRQIVYVKDRGILYGTRQGEDEPIDVKFDFIWEMLKYASPDIITPVTIEEALKGTGGASSWVSTSTLPCDPYCVDIIIKNQVTCTSILHEWITLAQFRWESLNHDPKAGHVAVSGKCNSTVASLLRTAT